MIITLFLAFWTLLFCTPIFAQNAPNAMPVFDFTIKPITFDASAFEMEGSIRACSNTAAKVRFFIPDTSSFTFTRNGDPISVDSPEGIDWECANTSADSIFFKGETRPEKKCDAVKGEIYCLNNSAPNPEVAADAGYYHLSFILPQNYGALTPDSGLPLKTGVQFQIAEFRKSFTNKSGTLSFEYTFPTDFSPKPEYLEYIQRVFQYYSTALGKPPYEKLKIGAIRREETAGTISGAPAGNLILFSRTALGDTPKIDLPPAMGITKDIADPMRKLVIAHELSHFWFSDKYLGQDGWMTEGIPQYLGLFHVRKDSRRNYSELIKFFDYIDKQAPQEEISNSKLNSKNGYIKAYYQAPLALVQIGDSIGHENLIELITEVFSKNPNPAFADFTLAFFNKYPSQDHLWKKTWRMPAQATASAPL